VERKIGQTNKTKKLKPKYRFMMLHKDTKIVENIYSKLIEVQYKHEKHIWNNCYFINWI